MGWVCHCRAINDKDVRQGMETLDPTKPVDHHTLSTHCGGEKGGYNCGKCSEKFQEHAREHNNRLMERQKALKSPAPVPTYVAGKTKETI